MAEIYSDSALSQRSDRNDFGDRPVKLTEVVGRAMIDIRIDTKDDKAQAAAAKALGLNLPQKPRTSITEGERAVLWLSVDQWLVTAPIAEREELMGRLTKTLEKSFALVCDMSDARAILRLQGAGAREIIMKGGSPDLLAPNFRAGSVRRMTFAEIAAMCHYVKTKPETLDLYVFRSYADYAWEWLAQTSHPNAAIRLWKAQASPFT